MTELGTFFRETREAKEISLEQAEAELKIKLRYIEALEDENYAVFPSVPMARGFIRNYASYLELDPDEMLAWYEGNGSGTNRHRARQPQGISFMALSLATPRSLISPDAIITALIISALVGSALFFAYTQYLEPAEEAFLNGESIVVEGSPNNNGAALLLPTPTATPTATPTPTVTTTPEYYTGVTAELVITDRTWLQISLDGQVAFDGFLEAGEQRRWDGEQQVIIRAGNAGGVEVFINGEYMGVMGETGQVIDQVWEKVDDVPPDPGETPTPAP